MIKRILLGIFLLCIPACAFGQASGAGNIGCPGATATGTVANSGTANNTVLATVTATPCPAVLVQLDQTTTITGGAITFNLSNDLGTNYTAVPVAQVINQSTFAQLTNPYTLVASTNQAFLILLNGATYFQVKVTTALTGTGAVTPYVTPVGLPPALALNANGLAKVDTSGVTQPTNIAQVNGSTVQTSASGQMRVGVVGNSGGSLDAAGQNAAAPNNEVLVGCQFNTSPTTITSGNVSPGQCDNKANFLVNVNAQSAATGAAPPTSAIFVAGLKSGATGGFLTGITVCDLDFSVNISTATTTLAVTGVSGRQVRICSIDLVAAAADNVAFIEGTGATCGTGTAGMAGGTTAASGWNFAANGGLTQGSGLGEVMTTATTGDSVCVVTSAATQLSGHIKYTIY
jgi:hypothetical protein